MSLRRQRVQVAVGLLLVVLGWITGFFTGSMLLLFPLAVLLVYPVIRQKAAGEMTEFAAYLVLGVGGLWFVALLIDTLR